MGTLIKRARDHTTTTSRDQGLLRRHFVIALGLATVFGLGWGFGLAATGSSKKEVTFVFQLIFSIFVGTQGVLIFILHGLRSQDARALWKTWFSTTYKSIKSYSITDRFSAVRSPADKQKFSWQLSTTNSGTLGRDSSTGTLQRQVQAAIAVHDSQIGAQEATSENPSTEAYEPNLKPENKLK